MVTSAVKVPFDDTPLEDDGTLDLVLMACEHPKVTSCGEAIIERMRSANKLLSQCSPWIKSGCFADEVLDANKYVEAVLTNVQAVILRLHDIDLENLQPGWGDKDSVSMACKTLIGSAQEIVSRLESLQSYLVGPVARKQAKIAHADQRIRAQQEALAQVQADALKSSAAKSRRSRSRSPARITAPEVGQSGAASRPASSHLLERCEEASPTEGKEEPPHFEWTKGMKLGQEKRYTVRNIIGEGTFGRVLNCFDGTARKNVAVKVTKGEKRYKECAEAEAKVLRDILRYDPLGKSRCVKMLNEFVHGEMHFCMVFEILDISLSDFLLANENEGLLLKDIRVMAKQLLQCLSFLASISLTHTDIKLRNVMLRDASADVVPLPRKAGTMTRSLRTCELIVIDFGGAVFGLERKRKPTFTRQYRAPEVVLGLPWDDKTDIWALGCIIFTLYTGQRPFPIHEGEDLEHLALMQHILGCELPKALLKAAVVHGALPASVSAEVDSSGRLNTSRLIKHVQKAQPLRERVHQHGLLMLLEGLLRIEPKSRMRADDAMLLSFVSGSHTITE